MPRRYRKRMKERRPGEMLRGDVIGLDIGPNDPPQPGLGGKNLWQVREDLKALRRQKSAE